MRLPGRSGDSRYWHTLFVRLVELGKGKTLTRFDIPWPSGDVLDRGVTEALANELGLRVTLFCSLATLPGSHHYHFKSGERPGTLELTLRPDKREAWFSIHSNRNSDWMEETVVEFSKRLAEATTTDR